MLPYLNVVEIWMLRNSDVLSDFFFDNSMKSPLRFILRFYYQQFHNISRNKVNSIWLQLLKNQKQQSYNKMCEYEKK